jgi:hypothetical protein
MNTWIKKNKSFSDSEKKEKLDKLKKVLSFVNRNFKYGFLKNTSQQGVSRVFFEAISVGSLLALEEDPKLTLVNTAELLDNQNFKTIIKSRYKTHEPENILQRINFVKDFLLNT